MRSTAFTRVCARSCRPRDEPRTDPAVLELGAALRRDVPAGTAAQVSATVLACAGPAGTAPSARTLQRHFARLELNTRPDRLAPRAFGRFEVLSVVLDDDVEVAIRH